jgi:hypothetical protein
MEFEEYLNEFGGWEVLEKSREQFEADIIFFKENRDDLLELYPDQWVSVFSGKVIASGVNLMKVQKIIDSKDIPVPYLEVTRFISTDKKCRLLNQTVPYLAPSFFV